MCHFIGRKVAIKWKVCLAEAIWETQITLSFSLLVPAYRALLLKLDCVILSWPLPVNRCIHTYSFGLYVTWEICHLNKSPWLTEHGIIRILSEYDSKQGGKKSIRESCHCFQPSKSSPIRTQRKVWESKEKKVHGVRMSKWKVTEIRREESPFPFDIHQKLSFFHRRRHLLTLPLGKRISLSPNFHPI